MNASGTLDPLAARAAGLADRRRARAARHQDRDAARARGQRRAARGRGRRAACSTRSGCPIPGLDGFAASVLPAGARARPPARRLDRRLRARRLRAGLPPPRRRGRHRRARAERLLPERQERVHLDRQRSRRDRGRRARLPRRHAAAAVGQALAQRRRPGRDRPRRRARRRRRARAHEHAARHSRSTAGRSRPLLGGVTGGLSGPALKPVALAAVYTCREACALPIVGVGGIASGWDALDFLAAGASAVQVGSAAFREPLLARRVREELAALLEDAVAGRRFGIENNNTRLEVHVFPAPERVFCRLYACAALMGCLRSADNDDRPEDPDPGTASIARPAHGGAAPRERGAGSSGRG